MTGFGYVGRILKVDLSAGNITNMPTSDYAERFLGGRGIGTKLYWDEVDPDVRALDPENRLIFITGPVTGVPPAGPRCQVYGKSPISDRFSYSSFAGKGWGAFLKLAGFDGLVVHGKADKPVYLVIKDGAVEIKDAAALWGKGSVEASAILKKDLGDRARVLATGPAGENKVVFATLLADGDASVSSGFGAVMGSKNLKAIAVTGEGRIPVAQPQRLREITQYVRQLYGERKQFTLNELPPDIKHDVCYGCMGCSSRSFYKAKNGTKGKLTCASGAFYQEWAKMFYGKWTEVPFFANRLIDRYGLDAWSMMATVILLGGCSQAGIISEEETGLPLSKIGSLEFIETLVKKISQREGLGDVLAQGPVKAAASLGNVATGMIDNLLGDPHGHLAVFCPRLLIYTGLAYALEPRQHIPQLAEIGGTVELFWGEWARKVPESYVSSDVLRSIAGRFWGSELAVDFSTYEGKALAAKKIQDRIFGNECLIACLWNFPIWHSRYTEDHMGDPAIESTIISAVTGQDIDEDQLYLFGEKAYNLQRAVMIREGRRGREDDRLPDHFHTQPLEFDYYDMECLVPGKNGEIISRKGEVLEKDKFEEMKSEFYSLREWDVETGLQKKAKLRELGLEEVAEDLSKRGLVL